MLALAADTCLSRNVRQKAEVNSALENHHNPCPQQDWQGNERKAFYKFADVLATKRRGSLAGCRKLLPNPQSCVAGEPGVAPPSVQFCSVAAACAPQWGSCNERHGTATAVMKLLGHTSPEMTMQYLDVTLNDLQRAIELARSKPRHLVPQPRVSSAPLREGLDGVIDSLLAAQHVLEMFRRTLPKDTARLRLNRLSNRLTKILIEARNLATPGERAEIGR